MSLAILRNIVFAGTLMMSAYGATALLFGQPQRQRELARLERELQREIWEQRSKRDGVYICGPCATGWLPGDCLDERCQAKDFH
jgi:hypothetical protein